VSPPPAAPEPDARRSERTAAPAPTQPSLRRLRAFGVRPKRDLGQNFLIDSNILDVIARAAQLGPDDVVLEIGGGLGVLSEHLAARAAHVHVVEVDRSLEPALRDALDPFAARATLHLADAMTLDLRALSPAPTKVVANLPYGIAAGAILRTIEELPGVTRWVAMVQKEVGERFAAQAGSGAYGVPSVLAQLACDVRVLRQISRRVFFPVPNVDSVLVGLERREAAAPPSSAPAARGASAPPDAVPPGLRTFVHGAFAHRRKALARSVALAGVADRDTVRAALGALGEPLDVRAERLAPERLRELWAAVERRRGAAPNASAEPRG
jgi:16S rRNA (adenine1518-N6/adenine1519-N6)-dimethyltransferase